MMYKLPKIPYTMDKDQSTEIPFRGINYSDRLSAGDLADSHGISLRRWPLVTNKRGREEIGAVDVNCRHVTTHDNNIIRFLDGGQIYTLDWQMIGSWDEKDDRSRRFANINSKTVIMPDKKYIEFDNEDPMLCELEATAEVINAKFANDSISGEYKHIVSVHGGSFKNENGESYFSNGVVFKSDRSYATLEVTNDIQSMTLDESFSVSEGDYVLICFLKLGIMSNVYIIARVESVEKDMSYCKLKVSTEQTFSNGEYEVEVYPPQLMIFEDLVETGMTLKFGEATSNKDKYYSVKGVEGNKIFFEETVIQEDIEGFYEITIYGTKGTMFGDFKKGDTVTISGCGEDLDDNNRTFTIQKVVGNTLYGTENVFVAGVEQGMVTITRKVPELNFICEAENRLWGCNNKENVIYISALGDPTNMYTYEGLTTDSFATAVGSPGDFTGCCRYGSSVLFFKEDKIHKILGTGPADYTLYSYDVEGIQARSDRSAVVINEVLYYKGTHGIYAYDGGVPTLISECFGERIFYDAVAGTDGVSYYVSMRDERYVWYLFSYNTTTGIWTLEDKGFEARDAMRVGMELYFLDKEGQLWKENAVSDVSRSEWMMQFAPLYETMNGKKTYSRILIRAELPKGSYMVIEIRCDGGRWMELGKIVGKSDGVVPIRIPVNRCDKFEIKLRGKGEFVLRSMLREFYVSEEP